MRTGTGAAPRAAKWASPWAAQRLKTASPSGHEAVGTIATRGRSRPVAASNARSTSAIAWVNSPEPTSAMTPPMAAESTGAAPRGASDSPDEEAPRGRGTSTLEATEHESDRHPHLKLDLL